MKPSVWVSLTLYFYLSIICSDSSAWHEAVVLLLQQEMDARAEPRACGLGTFSAQQQSNVPRPSRSTALHSTCKSRVLCSPSQEEDAGPRGAAVLSRASSGYQPPPDAARAHLHRAPGCSSKLFPAARRRELYLNTSLSRQARCSGGDGR